MILSHTFILSFRKFCLNKLTILSFFLIITSHVNAQIDIKSKVDAQIYSDYSRAIDLMEQYINPNISITVFVPSNEGLERLNTQIFKQVFINKNYNDVLNFINNHSLNEIKNSEQLNNAFSNSSSYVYLNNANSNLIFSKNPPYIMITDLSGYESNILSSKTINTKVVLHFISGVIKY